MTPKQGLRSFMHPPRIQRSADTPCATMIKRQIRPPVHNAIKIASPYRIEARMKSVFDLFRDKYRNPVGAEIGVQRVTHLVDRQRPDEIKMSDLSKGVDAGVRSPGADHVAGLSPDARRSLLQHPLNRGLPFLPLPSGEGRSVVLEGQLVTRHASNPKGRGKLQTACGRRAMTQPNSHELRSLPGRDKGSSCRF